MGVGCVGVGASGSRGGGSLVGEVIVSASLCPLVSLGCASFSALRLALVVAAVVVFWLAVCLAALVVPLISLVRVGVSTSGRCCVEVVASS